LLKFDADRSNGIENITIYVFRHFSGGHLGFFSQTGSGLLLLVSGDISKLLSQFGVDRSSGHWVIAIFVIQDFSRRSSWIFHQTGIALVSGLSNGRTKPR
jgi:hypothetical protein